VNIFWVINERIMKHEPLTKEKIMKEKIIRQPLDESFKFENKAKELGKKFIDWNRITEKEKYELLSKSDLSDYFIFVDVRLKKSKIALRH